MRVRKIRESFLGGKIKLGFELYKRFIKVEKKKKGFID